MTTTPRLWKSQTQVNTSDGSLFQGEGEIAGLSDGGYVIVWEDYSRTYNTAGAAVVGQRYDAAGNKVGGEVMISPLFIGGGDQHESAVTVLPNGNIAVAFVDSFLGGNDIYVRIFSSSLNFIRQDKIDVGGSPAVHPSITAFADSSYVVSYTAGSGDDTDIVGRIVSPNGVVGGQFDIDNQNDNRNFSEVARLSNGNFVAVYEDEFGGSSTDIDIKYGIFTPAGTAVVTSNIVPGAFDSTLEIGPDVAALRDGGFAVVWTDFDSTDGTSNVRATILSNTGGTIASDILVNTTIAGAQDDASVMALADGGFVVTWEDHSANLVRAQRFDALANKIGSEFTIATASSTPEAALLADGRFAYALGSFSAGDYDVTTSIWTTTDLNGTSLADVLDGSAGPDVMRGGLGNDTYYVYEPSDTVIENAGESIDRVLAFTHFSLTDNVENLDLLGVADLQGYGNGLANVINGNAGNNLIDGGAGADLMSGGAGNDVYFVDNTGDAVVEGVGQGKDTVFASINYALTPDVETLVLQGTADLQGFGNGLANAIFGNSGNNLIDGSAGADAMSGGAGNDVYFVDHTGDAVIEGAGSGNDTVFASINYALTPNVENLVLQGTADLQGFGNALANSMFGNAGNNLIDGGVGADAMTGGTGNDVYFVDNIADAVIEGAGAGNDAVFAFCDYGLAADVETLVLQGSGDFQGYGNNQANTLYGNAGNNLLNGAGGADSMLGGAGNDTYFIDNAGDLVFENTNEGTDAVFASVNYALTANVEALVLQGAGNLSGTGNALNNGIFGNSGDNTLDGGAGADALTGNAGNDTFVFNVGQANGDTVVDFAGNGAAAGDSLHFVGYGAGATFTNVDATHWQVNYNGGASHDVITFLNGATIDTTDFLFT
jgi:Ca2+-binding RTX toxin-like protein